MWRESYRIGVDLIDKQHMELFKMVGNLLDAVQNGKGDNRKECTDAIAYMKEYTLQHFRDEEDYQRSIGYDGLPEHQQIHQKFVQDVLNHEQKMIASDFSAKTVKDFTGTLIAWLIYHVAGADQQIVEKKRSYSLPEAHSPIDRYFFMSTCDVLLKITGQAIKSVTSAETSADASQSTITVQVDFDGDVSGTVTYRYTKQLAFNLMKNMASVTPVEIDDLVCSAMMEISNILCANSIVLMSSHGLSCNIGFPVMQVLPAILPSEEAILFDTGMGILEMELSVRK